MLNRPWLNQTNTTLTCSNAEPMFEGFDEMMVFFYIFVIFISTPGNLLLLFVVWRNPSMHTFTNFMICNCAVSDLLNTLIPGILNVIVTLNTHTHAWIFGSFMCNFLYLSIYWSVSVTIISLTVIAVDRYFVIIFSRAKLNTHMLRYVVPIIWVVGFGFASPSTFVMRITYDEGVEVCEEWWPPPFDSKESPKHYTIILFVFLYLVPLLVMSKIYFTIAQKMAEVRRNNSFNRPSKKKEQQSSVQPSTSNAALSSYSECTKPCTECNTLTTLESNTKNDINNFLTIPNRRNILEPDESDISDNSILTKSPVPGEYSANATKQETKKLKKRKSRGKRGRRRRPRVITMLITIVTSFAVCWFPVFSLQFLIYFHPSYVRCPSAMPGWAFAFAFLMHHCNSAITPLLYFGFSYSYRKGFRDSFLRRSRRQGK